MPESDRPALTWRELFIASFFPDAPAELVAWATPRLAGAMRDVRVRAGDTIYRAGEPSESAYFVVSGSVELTAPSLPAWHLGERAVVGILDASLERPRSRDATATKAAHLLEVPVSEWFEVLEDSIDMSIRTIQNLARDVVELRRRVPPSHSPADAPLDPGPPPVSLNLMDRILVLRRATCLRRAGVQTLETLASALEEVRLDPGATIRERAGDERVVYVVAHGEVEVGEPAAGFGRGTIVGGSVAFLEDTAYKARATRPTLVLRVGIEEWIDVMEEHFDLTRSMMMSFAEEREALMNAFAASE